MTEAAQYPVRLQGGDTASGLADMIHQYLSQNCADSPRKVRQARSLKGEVFMRAAEDDAICVRIRFFNDGIELTDVEAMPQGAASIKADFISVAHLTTGEEGPFGLLVKRKMAVSFRPGQIPFLVGVLRFMQIPDELREPGEGGGNAKWWIAGTLAAGAAGGAVYWYMHN